MSLINKALRKAQRDRTPARMPTGDPQGSNPGGSRHPGAPAANGYSPAIIIGLSLTVAVLIGLVVGLSIVILKDDPASTASTESSVAQNAAAPERLPQAAPAARETTDPQITPPVVPRDPPDAANPTSIVEQLRSAREAAETAEASKVSPTAEAPGPADETETAEVADNTGSTNNAEAEKEPEAETNDAVIQWLSASKISGVRLAGSASRVILNGKAYQAGETVNYNLGLKVLVIQESRVLFEDGNGKRYMKRF